MAWVGKPERPRLIPGGSQLTGQGVTVLKQILSFWVLPLGRKGPKVGHPHLSNTPQEVISMTGPGKRSFWRGGMSSPSPLRDVSGKRKQRHSVVCLGRSPDVRFTLGWAGLAAGRWEAGLELEELPCSRDICFSSRQSQHYTNCFNLEALRTGSASPVGPTGWIHIHLLYHTLSHRWLTSLWAYGDIQTHAVCAEPLRSGTTPLRMQGAPSTGFWADGT